MRLTRSLLLPCAIVAGLWLAARALAEDPAPPTPELLERKIQVLDLQVQYLRSREQALTTYVMQNQDLARALAQSLKTSRDQGFTQGAISSTSREALMAGLEALAKDMPKDLPAVTKSEQDLLEKSDRMR